jgi:hypothetical protein
MRACAGPIQVRGVFDRARAGEFDRALFTPRLADLLAIGIPGKTGTLLRGYGAINSFVLIGQDEHESSRTYRYLMVCEKATIIATCTYDSDGKIGGLSFHPE